MSVTLSIDVDDVEARAMLDTFDGGLSDAALLHEHMAGRSENAVRDYLRDSAQFRHATADRLGATPTGHLERAAESVASTFDAAGAYITVTSPGIGRAFHDVTIVPVNGGKYLTIAANAAAYGRRAGSFIDLRLAFFKGGTLALVKAEQSSIRGRRRSGYDTERAGAKDGRGSIYYWLVKEVHQKQDRSLMPSDAEMAAAAQEGALDYLRLLTSFASVSLP